MIEWSRLPAWSSSWPQDINQNVNYQRGKTTYCPQRWKVRSTCVYRTWLVQWWYRYIRFDQRFESDCCHCRLQALYKIVNSYGTFGARYYVWVDRKLQHWLLSSYWCQVPIRCFYRSQSSVVKKTIWLPRSRNSWFVCLISEVSSRRFWPYRGLTSLCTLPVTLMKA